jgi:hypothetical protein
MAAKKICFFITPIGHANSPERKRADDLKTHILNDVFAGKYTVIRADELAQPGSITHQVINWLYRADLVVADLTGLNPNVVYELAIRHAFNKVSIHLIQRGQPIPFDLKDERTLDFDIGDLRSVDECKSELRRITKEIAKPKFVYSSPVFRVVGVAAATDEERANFLETVADQLETIASDVSTIESEITTGAIDDIDKDVRRMAKDIEEIKLELRLMSPRNNKPPG